MYSPRPVLILSRRCAVRTITNSSRLAAGKVPADPTGRTPGFARPRRAPPQSSSAQQASPPSQPPSSNTPPSGKNAQVSDALQQSSADNKNNLLAPVHIPEDQNAILKSTHPATSLLANSSIVVQRQLEMMNVMLGFEQANRYIIMDAMGNHIGYLAEREHGLGNAIARQTFRTHRSFTAHVFDKHEKEVLRFHRPFSWISSRIKVYDAANPDDASYSTSTALQNTSAGSITSQTSASISNLDVSEMRVIGEAQQQWAPLRRKYNLFLSHNTAVPEGQHVRPLLAGKQPPTSESTALQTSETDPAAANFVQFAYVDEPFLSWDFSLQSEQGHLIGSVNRNFAGFAREIFTDTGVYALRMDAAGLSAEPEHIISRTGRNQMDERLGMTLDQRAVMLATAVSIDFDYFSRHSHAGGMGWFPFPIWMGGGAGEAAGAEAGAAGAGAAGTAEAAGEAGVAGEAGSSLSEAEKAARGAQEAARGSGMGEGGIAGAGSLAGYEAMQRSREQGNSPQQEQPQQPFDQQNNDDDFWGGFGGGKSGGGGGDSGGDGGGINLDDFF